MKSFFRLLIVSTVLFAFTACTKTVVPEEASVGFVFDHVVDDKALENGGPLANPNTAGNNFNTTTLKYIISNLVLIDQSGNEVNYDNYDIIDAFGSNTIDAKTIPNGTYEQIRFTLGVAATENTSTQTMGDLSPGSDMHFGGSDGYIFLKHEGNFLNTANDSKEFKHHYGRTGNEITFDIPAGGLKVNGVGKTAYMICNVNDFFAVDTIDFNDGPIRISTGSDSDWLTKMASNLPNSFTFFGSYEDR